MWNRYHVEEFYSLIDCKLWVIPFIHGFVSQVNFRSIGKRMSLILVSRRSRFFAGTRYLKRGINEAGFCANYVETEQILSVPSNRALFDQLPYLSSYIQVRGSMPFFRSQTPSAVTPKPPIIIDKQKDPRNKCTKKHFAMLFQKYSRNIVCLNLTKKKNNREGPLAREYEYFVNKVLNKDLPSQLKPIFIHYDVKANQKARKKLKDPEVL